MAVEVSKWKCTPYAGSNYTEASAPVPIGLRCWSNTAPNTIPKAICSCTENKGSNKYDRWSDGTGNNIYGPKYDYPAHNCTNYQNKGRSVNLDKHPVRIDTVATTQQIEQIRYAINTEINLRKGNPTYQDSKTSTTPSSTVNSEFLPGLPSNPSGSPANNTITSNMLMYKQLLETLEEYIKLADKEVSINLSGDGPSSNMIDFADTNIIQASDENTLTAIYAATYQDCVCYTDCNGYAVCWCYSNCNDY